MDFKAEKNLTFLRAAAQLLHDENAELRRKLAQYDAAAAELTGDNQALRDLLARREQALFGKSSERKPGEKPATPPKDPGKGHGPRAQTELAQVEVIHELAPDACLCPHCGNMLTRLGDEAEESEVVTLTARAFVLALHRRLKYRCACNSHVVTAKPAEPTTIVPGGRYSPEFTVEVASAKYAAHLPFERQVMLMRQDGLYVETQTLWDQVEHLATLATPTFEAIHEAILASAVVGADETRWPLMKNGKTSENKLYQTWCITNGEMVAYRILDSRGKAAAAEVLTGFHGVVMADGYQVYQTLAAETGDFVLAHCWAHVRRKFVEAEINFPTECAQALTMIRELYDVEREAAAGGDRAELRAARSAPILDALFAWARSQSALPRSGLGAAIAYMLNLEVGLRRYLEDPAIPIDNNFTERAVRGVVLGRKNHFGSRSRRGTEVAAIFYTLMESAKLAEVSPWEYLLAIARAALVDPAAVVLPAEFKASLSKSEPQA
jgi:transposase